MRLTPPSKIINWRVDLVDITIKLATSQFSCRSVFFPDPNYRKPITLKFNRYWHLTITDWMKVGHHYATDEWRRRADARLGIGSNNVLLHWLYLSRRNHRDHHSYISDSFVGLWKTFKVNATFLQSENSKWEKSTRHMRTSRGNYS